MKLNYIKNLNDGSLKIKEIGFWAALTLSFLFDLTLSFVSTPISIFSEIQGEVLTMPQWVINFASSLVDFIYQYGVLLIIIIIINRSFIIDRDFKLSNTISKKKYFAAAGMILGYIAITYGIFDMFLYSLPTLNDGLYEYLEEFLLNTDYIIIFIQTCIMAPIFEEVLYRGILLNGLLKRYSYKKAIVYSAIIFGIAHLNLPQGINACLLGIIIGIVYFYTKSLYACMLMHFINNFIVNFIFYPESELWSIILFIIVPIIGTFILIKSLIVIKKCEGNQNGQKEYTKENSIT